MAYPKSDLKNPADKMSSQFETLAEATLLKQDNCC